MRVFVFVGELEKNGIEQSPAELKAIRWLLEIELEVVNEWQE